MTQDKNPKRYDLEERTLTSAKKVIAFSKILPRTTANVEIIKQLIRSSGSVGANYMIPLKKGAGYFLPGVWGCPPELTVPQDWGI